jgi:hypothetical protein
MKVYAASRGFGVDQSAHEVTNDGSDRAQLAKIACQAKEALGVNELQAVADRGYFNSDEILACDKAGITVTLPKPMTSNAKAEGRFGKEDYRYVVEEDVYAAVALAWSGTMCRSPSIRSLGRVKTFCRKGWEFMVIKHNGALNGFNQWLLNGEAFSMDTMKPVYTVHEGRRYRLKFRNASDDIHPLHLHRHSFELVRVGGKQTAGVIKDVVMLGGFQEVEFDFVADHPGLTLFHCHQQLHMDFGFMFLFNYT